MTSPLDLVTSGLGQASGLSLASGGLLVLREFTPFSRAGTVTVPKVDVRLVYDRTQLEGDVLLEAGDLVDESSLESALLLSLFTDARATVEELERYGGENPRGWWGDADAVVPGDIFGSKLWLLEREVDTRETLARAREYAEQAVAWIVADGLADSVPVLAEYPRRNMLALQVSPMRTRTPGRERFAFVWEQ